MRKLFNVVLLMVSLALPNLVEAKSDNIFIVKGDEMIPFEKGEAFVERGNTYIPLRQVSELLDIKVNWESQTGYTFLTQEDKKAVIDMNNQLYTTDHFNRGQKDPQVEWQAIDIKVKNQKSYIPLRDFATLFEYSLSYIPKGPIVRIQTEEATLTDQAIYEKYKELIERQEQQVLYLTFDDGPNAYTGEILDTLKAYDMKATFFMLEGNMKKYPHIVKRIVDEGHAVGLHGVTHDKNKFYGGVYSPYNELEKANKTLESITGKRTSIVRMPYGSVPFMTDGQLQVLEEAGYKVWDWHVDSRDWSNRNGTITFNQVINQLNNLEGLEAVVLFHESAYTVETVSQLMQWMDENNKTSEALTSEMKGKSFKKGNLYK